MAEETAPTTEAAEPPTYDQNVDAALEEILGGLDDDEPKPAGEPAPETAAEPEAEAEPEETAAGADHDATAEDTPPKKPEKSAADKEAYEKALTAIARSKMPTSVIDGLDEAAVIEWGEKLASQQADTDRYTTELKAELKDAKEALEKRTDPSGIAVPAEGQPTAPNLQSLAQPVATELGLETPDALAAFQEQSFRALAQPLADDLTSVHADLKAAREELGTASELVTTLLFENARRDLVDDYDGLSVPDTYSKIRETAMKLGQAGLHGDVTGTDRVLALLRTAAKAELPAPESAKERESKDKLERIQDSGGPTRKASAGHKRKKSPEEITDAKAMMAVNGATPAEIMAAFPDD